MINALHVLIDHVGPGASVAVWTWAIAPYEVQAFQSLMWRGGLASASLIVDVSADRRNPELLNQWRDQFGDQSVRVVRNHAKIARVWGNGWRFLARGSLNLNFNPRFEQFDLTEGGADYDLVERLESELPVLPRNYTFADVAQASKLNSSFSADTLAAFASLQTLSDGVTGLHGVGEFAGVASIGDVPAKRASS